jgi:hypothetical protein
MERESTHIQQRFHDGLNRWEDSEKHGFIFLKNLPAFSHQLSFTKSPIQPN